MSQFRLRLINIPRHLCTLNLHPTLNSTQREINDRETEKTHETYLFVEGNILSVTIQDDLVALIDDSQLL